MKKDITDNEKRIEWTRRSIMYKQFDDLLTEEYGGDIIAMYEWIFSKDCSKQFSEKGYHDHLINDFHRWMRNRKISIHDI